MVWAASATAEGGDVLKADQPKSDFEKGNPGGKGNPFCDYNRVRLGIYPRKGALEQVPI